MNLINITLFSALIIGTSPIQKIEVQHIEDICVEETKILTLEEFTEKELIKVKASSLQIVDNDLSKIDKAKVKEEISKSSTKTKVEEIINNAKVENARKIEEERVAEEKRQAEIKRQEEERRRLEEAKKAEQARINESIRLKESQEAKKILSTATNLSSYEAFELVVKEKGVSEADKARWAEIIRRESGWNHTISNPYSGAYGLPQSLPGNKMASHGSDWQTNPVTQLRWMYDYMVGRYGSITGALNFWDANHWY